VSAHPDFKFAQMLDAPHRKDNEQTEQAISTKYKAFSSI
jgi:hypothetical protein